MEKRIFTKWRVALLLALIVISALVVTSIAFAQTTPSEDDTGSAIIEDNEADEGEGVAPLSGGMASPFGAGDFSLVLQWEDGSDALDIEVRDWHWGL